MIQLFKKIRLHLVLWVVMLTYFVFGPDLVTFAFAKNGKPLQTTATIPMQSDRITFVVEDLGTYETEGTQLASLYGWAFIKPEGVEQVSSFVREIALVSEERMYIFSLVPGYRNPGPQKLLIDAGVDLNTLGFNMVIAEDAIQPGKYRIGIIFRNPVTGSAFFADKPARYLIKTPNTLRFEKNRN